MTSTTTGRAARLVEHGKPLQIEPVELSAASADEVLVSLAYAGINPIDRYLALGKVGADLQLPRTLGGEASGHLADGTPVLVTGAGLGATRDGVFATSVVAPRSAIYELPDGVDLRAAASMGIAGLTTWNVVEKAGINADDRVLVLGASGGVGQSIVSYAASKGAQVWGQTGSEAKADAIREMGAKDAIVTDAAGLRDAVRSFAPTVVVDPLGGEFTAVALTLLEPRGRLILFGASSAPEANISLQQLYRDEITVLTYAGLIATPAERRDGLTHALAALADGRLRIRIDRELPLEEVNDAFAALVERSLTGKVVLRLSD